MTLIAVGHGTEQDSRDVPDRDHGPVRGGTRAAVSVAVTVPEQPI